MALDPAKVKIVSSFKHGGTFYSLCRDAESDRLFAGSDDTGIHVFDPAAKKPDAVAKWMKHDGYVSALVALKSVVISGSYDRQLIWWDAVKGTPIRAVEAHQGWIRQAILTPDTSRLVSVGDDMVVKIWDASDGKLIRTLEGHAKLTPQGFVTALYTVAVSPDGKYLASGDRHGEVRVWETDTGKVASTFQVPTLYTYDPRQRKRSIGGIRTLAFSPDGNLLAAGGIGQVGNVDGFEGPLHIEVWDWRKPLVRLAAGAKKQKGIVNHLLFHPDSEWLIGGGGGGSGFLAFWKVKPLPEASKGVESSDHYLKFDGHAHQMVFDPKKNELFAAGYRRIDVWKMEG